MKQKIRIYVTSFDAFVSSTVCWVIVKSSVLLYNNGFINKDRAKAVAVKSIKRLNRKVFKQYKALDCVGYRCYRADTRELYKKLKNTIKVADNAF